MTRDEALSEVRRRAGGDLSCVPGPVIMRAAERRGGRAVILRGGEPVEIEDVRALVETMESAGDDEELYVLMWTEHLSWLRMAITVTGMLGGSMRRLPDEAPDDQVWTVLGDKGSEAEHND